MCVNISEEPRVRILSDVCDRLEITCRNELMTCLNNLHDFRVYVLVGYDATLRTEAASYYETTLRPLPGACNFSVAIRTPNLTF